MIYKGFMGSTQQKTVGVVECTYRVKKHAGEVVAVLSDYGDSFKRYVAYIQDRWLYTTAQTSSVSLSDIGWHDKDIRELMENTDVCEIMNLNDTPFGDLDSQHPLIWASEPTE